MKGKFIVIEGINGSGGETQSKMLVSHLRKKGISAERIHYPEYGNPIGDAIREYLFGKYEPSPITLFLLYASDMAKDAGKVRSLLDKGAWVVADRHFLSTIAYQCLVMGALDIPRSLKFADLLSIPKPDSVIYLGISVDTSMKRKRGEHKELDRHESDSAFQSKTLSAYQELMKKNVLGKWIQIDAEKGIGEVFENVRKALGV
jgi:dTMP kinase